MLPLNIEGAFLCGTTYSYVGLFVYVSDGVRVLARDHACFRFDSALADKLFRCLAPLVTGQGASAPTISWARATTPSIGRDGP